MVQLKSLLASFWRRLDLVADDPGIEREWASVSEVNAFRSAARTAPLESMPAGRKARTHRTPVPRSM
jgi:hypothetical protein